MIGIKIVAVGRLREKYLSEGIKEYLKRLRGYANVEIAEVGDEACPERLSAAEEEKVKQKEGQKILKALSPQDYTVLLDIKGKELDSPGLADFLEERALFGQSSISFIIGGSLGVSEEVRERADFRWSFSSLTFPHQLIRLMLLEQIYRAFKINKGEPYHK